MLQSNSNNNAQQLHSEWKRYYMNDEIVHKPVRELTSLYLEKWALEKIESKQLTRKQYNNMATIESSCWITTNEKDSLKSINIRNLRLIRKNIQNQLKKTSQTEIFYVNEQTEVETLA